MEVLKPCPFCGAKAEYKVYKDSLRRTEISVGCTNMTCWCRHKRNLYLAPDKEYIEYEMQDMIDDWNNRQVEGEGKE